MATKGGDNRGVEGDGDGEGEEGKDDDDEDDEDDDDEDVESKEVLIWLDEMRLGEKDGTTWRIIKIQEMIWENISGFCKR